MIFLIKYIHGSKCYFERFKSLVQITNWRIITELITVSVDFSLTTVFYLF